MDQVSLPSDFLNDEENVQYSLDAANMQEQLAELSHRNGCWSKFLPIPFERASKTSWWDPTFDSDVLEDQFKASSNPHVIYKFRYALLYLLLVSSTWFLYYLISAFIRKENSGKWFYISLALTIVCVLASIFITSTKIYHRHISHISIFMAILLAILSLTFLSLVQLNAQLPLGYFAVCLQVLILIYTLFPLKLYMCVMIGVIFSILFEIFSASFMPGSDLSRLVLKETVPHPSIPENQTDANTQLNTHMLLEDEYPNSSYYTVEMIIIKSLTHFAIHLIGLHIFMMSNVRMRNTFMKVGQSLLVRRQLELEKKLKENMIHSLMPKSVVARLMKDNESNDNLESRRRSSHDTGNDIKSLFRPFNMSIKDNVSILFADICGFTKMSSNKSAEELVDILNNLFQRFDLLCKQNNCEKISTLGDCYYCISGCPDDNKDHAKNCVEMGLHMVEAIKEYDNEKKQGINMRVGIHTGKVLFGIVGTKRFKFDVWSNDVTLANRMESTGKPGMVHISEKTLSFLNDMYYTEDSDPVFGLQTYFILGRKSDRTPSYSGSFRAEGRQKYTNSLQLFVTTPSEANSLSPMNKSLSPQIRPRVLSCDTSANYAKCLDPTYNPNLLSPNTCKIKANSLPSILDTENEQNQDLIVNNVKESKSAEKYDAGCSAGMNGTKSNNPMKYSVKLRNWKIPKFIRKTSDQRNDNDPEIVIVDGGYQQVPTIIESSNPKKKESFISVTDNSESEDQMMDIDVKSYISQSRSDMIGLFDYSPGGVSDFIRGGSYRSQYGRNPNCEFSYLNRANSNRSRRGRSPSQFENNFEPTERTRSATVVLGAGNFNFNRPVQKRSLDISSKLSSMAVLDDNSITNSRKDSGIKSNSRRSSIQQLDSTLNNSDLMQHRVSGYYTSSQSTVNSPIGNNDLSNKGTPMQTLNTHKGMFFDKSGIYIQKLRKQSDQQLIKCVQENSNSQSNYFIKPPLSQITLFFKSKNMEKDYRQNVHSVSPFETLANSKFNTYLDVFVSSVVFLFVSFEILFLYGFTTCWAVTFSLMLCLQLLGVFLCLRRVIFYVDHIRFLTGFIRWNIYGTILVCLPMCLTLINFISDYNTTYNHLHLYSYMLFISLVHFSNFTQVNCWVKNFVAILCCLIFAIIVVNHHTINNAVQVNRSHYNFMVPNTIQINNLSNNDTSNSVILKRIERSINEDMLDLEYLNETFVVEEVVPVVMDNDAANDYGLISRSNSNETSNSFWFSETTNKNSEYAYIPDLFINLFLLLILVFFLNREFEIGYRLSFHANYVADKDKSSMETLKNQADYLIYNIVPEHVADKLKKDAKYSENFKNVAIIFASIVNFNDLYDETYEGGIEFLRVLNELIGDFDELLERSDFRCVEKIKTIGSTFMAASGLNSDQRNSQKDKNGHLYALMDFALDMQKVVNNFNKDLLEFNLILRVGYNIGDVTAAVIGNTKLYYDIWGDSVNIASRMDTTGVNGRIQVGENCLELLEKKYEFEARGSVYVKGKDNMNCYLLKRKKTPDLLCVPET